MATEQTALVEQLADIALEKGITKLRVGEIEMEITHRLPPRPEPTPENPKQRQADARKKRDKNSYRSVKSYARLRDEESEE